MRRQTVALLMGTTQAHRIFEPEVMASLEERTELVAHGGTGAPSLAEARVLLARASICVTSWGSPAATTRLLEAAPDLKLIVHAAGSIKPIVTDAVYERGITITSGAPAIGVGVAETALGFIILSMKNVFEISRATQEKGWNADRAARSRVKEMVNTTVGVVGAGHVGRHLLKLLRSFEVRRLLYDPTLTAEQAEELGATLVDMDTLMRESDVISLHAPSIPATRHMINAARLRLMKDGATLINTARGSLVDEEALVRELSAGRIRACLDVTDPEPPAPGSPLLALPNVTMTPHIAGVVTTGLVRLGRYVREEIERFSAGKPALNPVGREQLSYLA